jgi:hypothetical protein
MQIHNAVITGSFSYNGADLSNVTSSNAYSASLSSRTSNLETTASVLVGASASFSSILTSVSSSQQQISASLLNVIATGATTGSNSFRANQSITGSLTVTGQIVAQSLNVQQVTSSIVFSSGSNTFGSDLNSRQTFTGSVNITGSQTVFGNVGIGTTSTTHRLNISTPSSSASGIQITKAGVLTSFLGDGGSEYPIGVLNLYDSGSQKVQIYAGSVSYFTGGNVGIRTTTPQASLHIAGLADQNALTIGASNAFEIFITGSDSANIYHASPNQAIYLNTNGGALHLGPSNASTLLTISGSNVGIGTSSPAYPLQVRRAAGGGSLGISIDSVGATDRAVQYFAIQDSASGAGAGHAFYYRTPSSTTDTLGLLLNEDGNVGIGVTPSAWSGNISSAIEGRNGSAIAFGFSGLPVVYYLSNAFYNGSNWIYKINGLAALYALNNNDGSHQWLTAPSGTAGNAITFTQAMTLTAAGNLGIGTTNPTATLQVRGPNATGVFFDAQNLGAGGAVFSRINASSAPFNQYVFNNGNVGINRTPLSQLAVYGGPVQIMQDYPGHQIIIRSTGTSGTYSGQLTVTIPEMAGAGSSQGFGGYSCEIYVSGFQGMYCHAWFSGYINNGITTGEVTILRSSGGWSISQTVTGTFSQGFIFYIDYPASIVHPTARIIFNKGGDPNVAEYPGNQITAVWS